MPRDDRNQRRDEDDLSYLENDSVPPDEIERQLAQDQGARTPYTPWDYRQPQPGQPMPQQPPGAPPPQARQVPPVIPSPAAAGAMPIRDPGPAQIPGREPLPGGDPNDRMKRIEDVLEKHFLQKAQPNWREEYLNRRIASRDYKGQAADAFTGQMSRMASRAGMLGGKEAGSTLPQRDFPQVPTFEGMRGHGEINPEVAKMLMGKYGGGKDLRMSNGEKARLKLAQDKWDYRKEHPAEFQFMTPLQMQQYGATANRENISREEFRNKYGYYPDESGPHQEVKKPLSPHDLATYGKARDAIGGLGKLDTELDAVKDIFGPLEGRLRNLNPYDERAVNFDALKRQVKQVIGTTLEGGVLREADEYKYEHMIPKISDTYQSAKDKLRILRETVTQNHKNNLRALDAQGYMTDGLMYDESALQPAASGEAPPTTRPATPRNQVPAAQSTAQAPPDRPGTMTNPRDIDSVMSDMQRAQGDMPPEGLFMYQKQPDGTWKKARIMQNTLRDALGQGFVPKEIYDQQTGPQQ